MEIFKPAGLKDYLICLLICFFTFIIFFYGNEWIAQTKKNVFVFAFQWEKKIPYLSYFFFVYYGIFLLPFFVPFLIKRKDDLTNLTKQIVLAILISGVFFFFFTTKSIYPPPPMENTFWIVTYKLTGKYNLFPSLHVILTLLFLKPFKYYSKNNIKLFFSVLAVLLLLSTLFTHQHHIADVIGGLIVYKLVTKLFLYEFEYKL